MCFMLFAVIVSRHSLHKATESIVNNNNDNNNNDIVISIEEEVIAEHLLQDLAPSQRVPCGKEKCFYRSKSNADFGYLVARCSRDYSKTDRFERLVSGWNLAQELERTYNMKHFLKGPPEAITVSQDLSTFFNRNLWFESHEEKLRGSKAKRFPVGSHAYVQKVKVAPTPNLLLAVAPSNQIQFDNSVEEFLLNATPSFARRLHKNLVQTRTLLQKEPCLIKDFQVLMDQRGELYHLDFDRCFQPREVDETEECFQYLDNVESQILGILTQIQAGNITLESLRKDNATIINEEGGWVNEDVNFASSQEENVTFITEENDQSAGSTEEERHDDANITLISTQLESFRPENLAMSKRVPCGKEKCVYRSISDDQVGYLVSLSSRKKNSSRDCKTLELGWQFAEQLRRKYNIEHFLLAPPGNVTVSQDLASRLNRNLWSEKRRTRPREATRYPEGSSVCVQKVKLAPKVNLLIGSRKSKLDVFEEVVDDFLSFVKHKESFLRRFKSSLASLRKLLHNEQCLVNDFQALVDTRGDFYHLDFDRCFHPENVTKILHIPAEEVTECFEAIDTIEIRVEWILAPTQTRQPEHLVLAE